MTSALLLCIVTITIKISQENSQLGEKKCLKAKKKNGQALFGIVQGGCYQDLREESSAVIGSLPFDGFGIGGSFGEKQMEEVIGWSLSGLPEDKPRHLLGIGAIKDIFIGAEKGIDSFDCVIPTREAEARRSLFQRRQAGYSKGEFLPKIKRRWKKVANAKCAPVE